MVDYCKDNNIILQPVVAYNHTMQARVEGAIGCSKQHSCVALVCANKPTRFWPDATLDFTCKRNALWAKRDHRNKDNFQLPTLVCRLPLLAHIEQ